MCVCVCVYFTVATLDVHMHACMYKQSHKHSHASDDPFVYNSAVYFLPGNHSVERQIILQE